MPISLREAADLGFQIALAVAAVVCTMAITDLSVKHGRVPGHTLDVRRPILWAAVPVRIDRENRVMTADSAIPNKGQSEDSTCLDAIGLRMSCDLIAARRSS